MIMMMEAQAPPYQTPAYPGSGPTEDAAISASSALDFKD
jgi:hypothetical protein